MLSGSDSPNQSHDIKSHDIKSHDSNEDERDGDGLKFKWRGFKGQTKGAESPIMEGREKGHSRSTSLDLNKMLLGEGNTEGKRVWFTLDIFLHIYECVFNLAFSVKWLTSYEVCVAMGTTKCDQYVYI